MKQFVLLAALLPLLSGAALAQATYPGGNPPPKPDLTEIWSPVPPKVEPGKVLGQPPSDAIILFNGKDLSGWESVNGGPAEWAVENGEMVDQPKAGHIQTKQKFGDVQLHVEWMIPVLPPERKGQDRGTAAYSCRACTKCRCWIPTTIPPMSTARRARSTNSLRRW